MKFESLTSDGTMQDATDFQKYQTYLENAPYGVFIVNEKGEYQEVNNAACLITGYAKNELLKMSIPDLIPDSDKHLAKDHFETMVKTGKACGTLKFINKKGDIRSWTVEAVKLTNTQFMGFAQDVTEIEEAKANLVSNERKYREIFINMQNAFALHEMVFDEEGRPVDYIFKEVNPAFERLTGLKRENLIDKKVTEALPGIENDPADWIGKYGQLVLSGESISFENYSGALEKWYSVAAYKHKENGFGVIFSDITDIKKAEEEKEMLHKRVIQSAKLASIGELAAGVGHEINNPLAIACGNIELLQNSYVNSVPQMDQPLKNVMDSLLRIRNIVTSLRTMARKSNSDKDLINVNVLIEHTINLLKNIYNKKEVFFNYQSHGEELFIQGNTDHFQQILLNLLANAKDAMLEKGGTINIKTGLKDNMVVLEVADEGTGMGSEELLKIFDAFYTTKPIGQGTGLGLSITHSIVGSMNGNIDVQSTPGKGSTFTVCLPNNGDQDQIKIKKAIDQDIPRFSGRALIVDDEELLRDVLTNHLGYLGLEVDEADNGLTALEKLKENDYQYIFTDDTMPKMPGVEFIQELRKAGGNEKIILITGNIFADFPAEKQEFYNRLTRGILEKPFKLKDVIEILKKASKVEE